MQNSKMNGNTAEPTAEFTIYDDGMGTFLDIAAAQIYTWAESRALSLEQIQALRIQTQQVLRAAGEHLERFTHYHAENVHCEEGKFALHEAAWNAARIMCAMADINACLDRAEHLPAHPIQNNGHTPAYTR